MTKKYFPLKNNWHWSKSKGSHVFISFPVNIDSVHCIHMSPTTAPCVLGHQLPLSDTPLRGGPHGCWGAADCTGCPAGSPKNRKVGEGLEGSREPSSCPILGSDSSPSWPSILQGEAAAEVPAELPHHRAGQDHGHVPCGATLCQDAGAKQATWLPALRHHHCGRHDRPGAVRRAGQVGGCGTGIQGSGCVGWGSPPWAEQCCEIQPPGT